MKNTNCAASAAFRLPVNGASRYLACRSWTKRDDSRVSFGATVAWFRMMCSGPTTGAIDSRVCSNAGPSETKIWIVFADSATSDAEDKKFGSGRGVRFQTQVWKPALRRFADGGGSVLSICAEERSDLSKACAASSCFLALR